MGAGKTTLGAEVAKRLGRRFIDVDRELERSLGRSISALFAERGEAEFRALEAEVTVEALRNGRPAVLALGGGAVKTASIRRALRDSALTVLVEVDPDAAWERVRRSNRPLAQDPEQFRSLYERRQASYEHAADARGRDADDIVLAAGGVRVAAGALEGLGELIPGDGPLALVADSKVASLHGARVRRALGSRLASSHELPPGEEAKSIAACERLWQELRLERGDRLVAFGGGCTTDAAGFAAATYLRGVPWVAVPTTLVGQIDAAIGGKTALNLPQGKNLVGAFHWPDRTVVDPTILATLPEHEHTGGMAEVVKTGLLAGEPLWGHPEGELVRRCAAFKTALCLRDPHDRGPRVALNLGHTFAHALEAAADYETVTHGQAVALGLLAALRLSTAHLGLDPSTTAEVERLVEARPVWVDRERAWAALARDKKAEGGTPKLVLLEAPGRPALGIELPAEVVRAALDELIAR